MNLKKIFHFLNHFRSFLSRFAIQCRFEYSLSQESTESDFFAWFLNLKNGAILGAYLSKCTLHLFLLVQSRAFGEDFFNAYKPCQSLMCLFVFFHTI